MAEERENAPEEIFEEEEPEFPEVAVPEGEADWARAAEEGFPGEEALPDRRPPFEEQLARMQRFREESIQDQALSPGDLAQLDAEIDEVQKQVEDADEAELDEDRSVHKRPPYEEKVAEAISKKLQKLGFLRRCRAMEAIDGKPLNEEDLRKMDAEIEELERSLGIDRSSGTFMRVEGEYFTIKFQHGPVQEVGTNGCQIEDILKVLRERLEGFQSRKFACEENAAALNNLKTAEFWLNERTSRRRTQGVEGFNKQHESQGVV